MELNEKLDHDTKIKTEAVSTTPSVQRPQPAPPKYTAIVDACRWKDAEALRSLAVSEGGLLSDDLRCQAWPVLLGNDVENSQGDEKVQHEESPWRQLPPHRDEDQVSLDVNRSFIYYPHDQSQKQLDIRKEELSDLITEVLRRQPYLCYFQGYHDICQVFLLVLDPSQRSQSVARLSGLRIRDFMLPTLAPALAQLHLIPAILSAVRPELWDHLSQTQPYFALSGTLTMYAHDIQEYSDISRLFDAFLAREAAFSVYMFAQIILQRSEELFDIPADEPEMLHSVLSKLPKTLDLELLIGDTAKLIGKYPPESLREWRSISKSSVLKTARSQEQIAKQTLKDGEMYFQRQVTEMRWAERRQRLMSTLWKYRRPAGTVGLAILVGLYSYYMRKSPGVTTFMTALLRRWHA